MMPDLEKSAQELEVLPLPAPPAAVPAAPQAKPPAPAKAKQKAAPKAKPQAAAAKAEKPEWDATAVLLTYQQGTGSTQGPLGALPARDLTGQEVADEIRSKAGLDAILETGLYTAPDPLPRIPWPKPWGQPAP